MNYAAELSQRALAITEAINILGADAGDLTVKRQVRQAMNLLTEAEGRLEAALELLADRLEAEAPSVY